MANRDSYVTDILANLTDEQILKELERVLLGLVRAGFVNAKKGDDGQIYYEITEKSWEKNKKEYRKLGPPKFN